MESIASKNPKELTALFEQISGSEELKKDYEELEVQKARAEEKTAFNYQKRRTERGGRETSSTSRRACMSLSWLQMIHSECYLTISFSRPKQRLSSLQENDCGHCFFCSCKQNI